MEIVLAKTAGFCFGVQNAINTALSAKGKIVTLGDIIHNELVVNNLKEKGIYPINSLEDYVDGKIVIRSHGVGKKMYEQMQERGIEYGTGGKGQYQRRCRSVALNTSMRLVRL